MSGVRILRPGPAIAVALLVASATAGALWWRGRPERHLACAEEAIREGEPGEALAWLDLPQATRATRDRALLLRARVAVERGDLAGAVRALDTADPDSPDFPLWKGRTLYAAKQPALAIPWFESARARRPDDAEPCRWLAAASYDLGLRPVAVEALRAVTRLDPVDARAWATLGMIFKEDTDYEQARDAFEHALKLDRARPDLRIEMAEMLLRLGDPAGAARELAACRGRVDEGRHAELLAESLQARGDLDGHRAAVDAGLAVAPDRPGLLAQRAQIDLFEGRAAEALARLDLAVAADPYRPETIYQRGVVHRRLGRAEEARRDLDRAAALNRGLADLSDLNQRADRDPHDADVRARLGRLCVELGKPELAASWYRAALACDPGHAGARLGLNALRAR